jgi:hypothetical protein
MPVIVLTVLSFVLVCNGESRVGDDPVVGGDPGVEAPSFVSSALLFAAAVRSFRV